MTKTRGLALPFFACALVAWPAGAWAATGAPAAPEGGTGTPDNGGARIGEPALGDRERDGDRRAERRRGSERPPRGAPVLVHLAVNRPRFFMYGAPARVTFEIRHRSPALRARLDLVPADGRGTALRLPLGEVPTGRRHTARVTGREAGELPEGRYEVRVHARDSRGRRVKRAAETSDAGELQFLWHRFPLVGKFDYGGEDARFGAGRPGHTHEGQDLIAPGGTPVVAPRGGVVKHVAYQAEGAGHYVVVDGEGEDRDYAFMHLTAGSVAVRRGQRVRTGQQLGTVGSTGASSGHHLHFEIWEGGGWYSGGKAVDPLPYLRAWEGSA